MVSGFYSSIDKGRRGIDIDHETIVRRALAGDGDAFRSLVEEYKDLVYMICFHVIRDSFEAENLAQETFIQVYKSLPKYEFRGFKTWISRIALNKALDFKRSSVHKLAEASIPLTEVEDRLTGEETEVEKLLLMAEEKELLAECIRGIPQLYSNVIKKSYQENKSVRQIAMEENVSIRTIETRLYRGKKYLREYYKELSKT